MAPVAGVGGVPNRCCLISEGTTVRRTGRCGCSLAVAFVSWFAHVSLNALELGSQPQHCLRFGLDDSLLWGLSCVSQDI